MGNSVEFVDTIWTASSKKPPLGVTQGYGSTLAGLVFGSSVTAAVAHNAHHVKWAGLALWHAYRNS